MRNYALSGTFVFLPSSPVNNVFQAVNQSGRSCDVSHRLCLSHKRHSDPSEQVPRGGKRQRESCCGSQGHIHTFTITMREVEGCPLRICTAQQRGHTHRACTHSYLHSVQLDTQTHIGDYTQDLLHSRAYPHTIL